MAIDVNDPRIKALKARVQQELSTQAAFDGGASEEQVRTRIAATVAEVNRATAFTDADGEAEAVQLFADDFLGLGPIERLLREGGHSEIMVNGGGVDRATGREGLPPVYVEDHGVITPRPDVSALFDIDDVAGQKRRIIERIAAANGMAINEEIAILDASLSDGSRVHAALWPISDFGSTIDVRVFEREKLSMDQLVRFGTLTPTMARFLKALVLARCNIVVSGGTGSGKTTMLNCLSEFFPAGERVDTIEDTRELQLKHKDWNAYRARPANAEGYGEVTIRQLLQGSLRNRPDRIVVGEVRGDEALEMLQAMQTGHDGSLTTVHASNPAEALTRIETMVSYGGLSLPAETIRRQIVQAIDVIVQVSRLRDGSRAVTEISCVTGMEGQTVTMEPMFRLETDGLSAEGRVTGDFRGCEELPPQAIQRKMDAAGAEWDRSWFYGSEPYGTGAHRDFSGMTPDDAQWGAAAVAPSAETASGKPQAEAVGPSGDDGFEPGSSRNAELESAAMPDVSGMPEDLVPESMKTRRGRFPWRR